MELFCPCHSTGSLVSLQFPTTGRASKTVFFKHNLPLSHKLYNTLTIESLKGLWEKFSLLNDEENGIECTKKDAPANFILAAKFLTKRIMNVESVAHTFQPLWKLKKDVQIKDMGENILFFHFEDECDHGCQNRVLDNRIA